MKTTIYLSIEDIKRYYWDSEKHKLSYTIVGQYGYHMDNYRIYPDKVTHTPTGRWKTNTNKVEKLTKLYIEFERVVTFKKDEYIAFETIKQEQRVRCKQSFFDWLFSIEPEYDTVDQYVNVTQRYPLETQKEKIWVHESDILFKNEMEASDYEEVINECE